jgi:hypothetical protein
VLALLGGLLQYLRGYEWFEEWGYHLIAVALAAFGYWMFNQVFYNDPKYAAAVALLGVSGNAATIYGGTFLASSGAKKLAASGKPAIIPVTNSK